MLKKSTTYITMIWAVLAQYRINLVNDTKSNEEELHKCKLAFNFWILLTL
jgi:hypothetical protein